MKTYSYMLLIFGAYITGLGIGILCPTNLAILFLFIPATYVFWRGHKSEVKYNKMIEEVEKQLKK